MSRAATRARRTLYAQCEQHANEQHSRRLAELAGLAPALARMDDVVPVLKKHDLELTPDRISLWKTHDGVRFVNTLRITPTWFTLGDTTTRWLIALREAGFRPVHVSDGPYPTARLRKGPTLLTIDVTMADAAALRAELSPPVTQEAA